MCPRTKEQVQEIRSASKQKIMEAALKLFASKGYSATSISDISKEAEVSKGLMYNYFESKEHLLVAVAKNAIGIAKDIIEHPNKEYDNPADEIIDIVNTSINHIKLHFNYWKAMLVVSFQPDAMLHINDLIEQNSQWGIQKGTKLFAKLGVKKPETHSLLFGATMDGMVMHYIHMNELYPIDEMMDALINTFVTPYTDQKTSK